MGISMEDSKLVELARLISEWHGLTSRPAAELIDDSLVLLEHLGEGPKVVDVGSGGALPGLPLKIARPDLSLPVVEAGEDKGAFLVRTCAVRGLRGVLVLARRAEEVRQEPLYGEAF